jgi:hypothetical protein
MNHDNITLLDYFAGQALAGDLASLTIDSKRFGLLVNMAEIECCTMAQVIAREAYEQAEAMVAEKLSRDAARRGE